MNSENYKQMMKQWPQAVDHPHHLFNLLDERIIEHFIGRILFFIFKIHSRNFLFSWLRQKYEQSKEEQRQLGLESRRLRRRQRRSIKRFRLQQDLQLARSFGYS